MLTIAGGGQQLRRSI